MQTMWPLPQAGQSRSDLAGESLVTVAVVFGYHGSFGSGHRHAEQAATTSEFGGPATIGEQAVTADVLGVAG